MREALLALALLTTVAAALRARTVAGSPLAFAGLLLAAGGFVAAAFLPAPAYVRGPIAVWAAAALSKSAALGRGAGAGTSFRRALAYLALWPGLDADRAFARDPAARRGAGALRAGLGALEVALAFGFARAALALGWLSAGEPFASWARCVSMVALIDGAFRASSGAFEAAGLASEQVFRDPWLSRDLAEFWARRWNRFVGRTLALDVYAPVKRRAGRVAAVFAAFLASGVMHEALFRLPAEGPDGRYTAFFLAHGAAVVALGFVLPGAGRGRGGRIARRVAAWAVLLATAPLFFGGCYPAVLPLERALP